MKSNIRKGFTLIELLIVVVIIGILAAIAIPKFASTKEKAYLATMKTDLRNLATSQEGYASNHAGAYVPSVTVDNSTGTGTTNADLGYLPSSGVKVDIVQAGAGWSATASHTSAPGKTCQIYVNTTAPAGATGAEGEPTCK